MNTNEITPEFKAKSEEYYRSMDDNTQVDDPSNKLRFVKMNMPAEHMDFLMDYYKLPNLVEVNRASIYVLKTLAHMEKDGYKLGIFKTEIQNEKTIISDSFMLNISDMIKSLLKHINE